MSRRIRVRSLAFLLAVAGGALLQGCAVTTGTYMASKSTLTNRSMTSRYDVLRQGGGPSQYRTLPATRQKGLFDYRYY